MSDNYNNQENSDASRFDHKSQGLRTQSRNAKKAKEEEAAINDAAAAAQKEAQEALSAKLAESFSDINTGSPSKKKVSTKVAKAFAENDTGSLSSNRSSSAKGSSFVASAVKSSAASASKASADRFSEAMKLAETEDTVFLSESDIPAYEIGLGTSEFYVPPEIRSGKVRKITEEQFDALKAKGPKRRKTRREKKKAKKVKKTPLQRVLKAVMWLAIWAIVFIIGYKCYSITYSVFYDVAKNPGSTTKFEYTVTAGATDESVYADLEELGVMNCSEFIYQLRAIIFDADYVEGTYTLSDGYSMEKIINILSGYSYSDDDDEE